MHHAHWQKVMFNDQSIKAAMGLFSLNGFSTGNSILCHHEKKNAKKLRICRLTLKTLSLGDGNAVYHLVLGKHRLAANVLLEEVLGKVDLSGDSATVQLDLNDVSLLLATAQELLLSVADEAHNAAVLLDLVQLLGDLLLAEVILPLL
jgi:hypothetical protein